MATTATETRGNGQRAPERARTAATRNPGAGRRRQLPLVVVGVLLVLGGALAFADASVHLGSRQEVLVVTQPLAAGQVLTSGDLGTAKVSTGSGLQAIPLTQESTVLGRSVAVPLVAGALLTTSEVGSTTPVASGSDVVAVGLKAGAFPPDLAPGVRVQVVPVSSSDSGGAGTVTSGSPVSATVMAVEAASADSGSPTVFSLLVSKGDADEVASLAAAGEASLVQVGAGS
jgi:hypothetical protein